MRITGLMMDLNNRIYDVIQKSSIPRHLASPSLFLPREMRCNSPVRADTAPPWVVLGPAPDSHSGAGHISLRTHLTTARLPLVASRVTPHPRRSLVSFSVM